MLVSVVRIFLLEIAFNSKYTRGTKRPIIGSSLLHLHTFCRYNFLIGVCRTYCSIVLLHIHSNHAKPASHCWCAGQNFRVYQDQHMYRELIQGAASPPTTFKPPKQAAAPIEHGATRRRHVQRQHRRLHRRLSSQVSPNEQSHDDSKIIRVFGTKEEYHCQCPGGGRRWWRRQDRLQFCLRWESSMLSQFLSILILLKTGGCCTYMPVKVIMQLQYDGTNHTFSAYQNFVRLQFNFYVYIYWYMYNNFLRSRFIMLTYSVSVDAVCTCGEFWQIVLLSRERFTPLRYFG